MTYKLKTYTLRNYKTIPQIANLSDEMIEAIEVVGRVLPFKTNNYVTEELIDWTRIDSARCSRSHFREEKCSKKNITTQ